MKQPTSNPTGWLLPALVGLVLLVAAAPTLISLSHALLPVIVVAGVVVIAVRLIFFHTRRF